MKNSYILLRNNKESVSLNIEDLQQIGLTQTDLIWVECQSVGWRSPLEISELKNLVSSISTEDKKNSYTESLEKDTEFLEIKPAKNSNKKLVLMEVPAREEPIKKQEALKPVTDPDIVNFKKYANPDHGIHPGFEKKGIDQRSNDNKPSGEIKEMFGKNPEQKDRQKKSSDGFQGSKLVKKIALYTGLVIAGALIMFLIQNLESKTPADIQQTVAPAEKVPISTAAVPTSLQEEKANTSESFEEPNFPSENISATNLNGQKKSVAVNKNATPKKDEKIDTQDDNNAKTEKNIKPDNEIKPVKPVTAENISSKLALKVNEYNVGAFGGIRNLKMTLQNDSRYLLDKVTVEIKYLNPEGKILNTEHIYFQYVQPGEAPSIKVEKSKRGVKVDFKITNIESKELVSSQQGSADPDNYSKN